MIISGDELQQTPGLQPINSDPEELLTTGMCSRTYAPYGSEASMTLDGLGDYCGYDFANLFWTCHERALYGVANLKYRHPGIRAAIALGTRTSDGKPHTIIVFWKGEDIVNYDPEKGALASGDFRATKIVPFPVPGKGKFVKAVPGFESFGQVGKGYLILAANYDADARKNEVKNHLENLAVRIGLGENFLPKNADVDKYNQYFPVHDRVLWECMAIRNKFRGFPLGMAFGELPVNGVVRDAAVLVYWEGGNSAPVYWGLKSRKLVNFKPRIVIV
jgi:hypothetical protein